MNAGESFVDLTLATRPRVGYDLVALHRLDAEPGTRNLVRLLTGVVDGNRLERLARAAGSLTERIAELGDGRLERSLVTLVQAQGNEKRREFACYCCGNLAELVRQLEDGEVTWPEKWIEQMCPQFEDRLRREFHEKLRLGLAEELRQELAAELRQDLAERLHPDAERKLLAELLPRVEKKLLGERREAHRDESDDLTSSSGRRGGFAIDPCETSISA